MHRKKYSSKAAKKRTARKRYYSPSIGGNLGSLLNAPTKYLK